MRLHFWLIEDDIELSQLVSEALFSLQYDVTVSKSIQEVKALDTSEFDFLIADVSLVDGSLHEVFKEMIVQSKLPVLMLTSSHKIEDKSFFLEQGADDYLTKPFSIEELLLRIKSIWRRSNNLEPRYKISKNLDYFPLDLQLVYKGEATQLTFKEAQLLLCFLKHPDTPLNQDDLLQKVWGIKRGFHSNLVPATLRRLRKKMSFEGRCPDLIHTNYRSGYVFSLSNVDL